MEIAVRSCMSNNTVILGTGSQMFTEKHAKATYLLVIDGEFLQLFLCLKQSRLQEGKVHV